MSRAHINSQLEIKNTIVGAGDTLAAFFPFSNHANDIVYGVQPTINRNTTLTQDGVIVEPSTTNLAKGVFLGFNGDRWEKVSDYPDGLPFIPNQVYRRRSTNTYWGSFNSFIPTSPTPYNRTFTISFWYYLEPGYDGTTNSGFYGAPTQGGSEYTTITTSLYSTFSSSVKGQWRYGQQTLKITTDAYSYVYVWGWGGGTIDVGKHCYIANFQIEEEPFATSFVNGPRDNSNLYYTFPNISNWNSYSLYFEYKHPDCSIYTHNMVFASSYDGTTGGDWFGLSANSNNINMGGNQVVSTPDIWHNVIFTYDGTNSQIYIDGIWLGTKVGKWIFYTDILSFSSMFGWGTPAYLTPHTIKNVTIYNHMLSAEDIISICNSPVNFNSEEEVCT